MKNLKAILIYGIILILCIAAFAGYYVSRQNSSANKTAAAQTQVSGVSAPSESKASAEAGTETAAPAGGQSDEDKAASSGAVLPSDASPNAVKRIEYSSRTPDANPIVGVGRGDDYASVTRTAVENAGGFQKLLKKGGTVLIKPNICINATPGSGIITDYRMVQEIVKMCTEYGAGKIIIAEGPISGTAFEPSEKETNGYKNITGVEFIDLNKLDKADCYEIKAENSVTGKSFFIPKVYMDADLVISAPKLKTHFQPDALVSLCLKNMYGVPPGQIYGVGYKYDLHNMGLKESIVDLNKIGRADFFILDGIVGGEGYGPQVNTPVDSKIIFAGTDPVAIDTAALTFMGYTIDDTPHVKLAMERNVGIGDLSKIKVVGAELDKIKMEFKRP